MQDGYSIEAFDTTEAPRVTALAELIEMIEAFDEHPDPSDEGDVRELLSRPHFEASNDLVVAMSGDALIGWAAAVSRPSSVRFVRSGLRGGVHPAHRRSGVGSALLAWSEQRGRGQMAAADPSLPRWLAVEVLESQSSLRRLAHQHGFEERRWFIDMNAGSMRFRNRSNLTASRSFHGPTNSQIKCSSPIPRRSLIIGARHLSIQRRGTMC